jgi:hypothetical protein
MPIRWVMSGGVLRALAAGLLVALAVLQAGCGGATGGLGGDLAGAGESTAMAPPPGSDGNTPGEGGGGSTADVGDAPPSGEVPTVSPGEGAGAGAAAPLAAPQLLGRWVAPAIDPGLSLVLGPSAGDDTVLEGWMLASDLRNLARLQVRIDQDETLTIEGWRWPLGRAGAREAVRERGVVVGDRSALMLQASQLTLMRQGGSEVSGAIGSGSGGGGVIPPIDPLGRWVGSFDAGRIRVELSLGAAGSLTGASSTGCRVVGQWSSRAAAPWIDVSLDLDCGVGVQRFSGIGTVGVAGTGARALTLAMVGETDSEGSALVMMLAR